MDAWAGVAITVAAVGAGAINAIVGSGTLITFPTLLALGVPAVSANVSNTVGLVFGGVTGTWGYRRELAGQRSSLIRLAPMSAIGAVVGAILLLRLPAAAFATIVPILLALSLVLVLIQPWIGPAVTRRRQRGAVRPGAGDPLLAAGTLAAGVYGGYFGAAQGVLLVGLLGSLLDDNLQRVNATKNLLSLIVNCVAAVTFLVVRPEVVNWRVAALIALGSLLGGLLGSAVGRWLPQPVLRGVIVVVGVIAIVRLLAG